EGRAAGERAVLGLVDPDVLAGLGVERRECRALGDIHDAIVDQGRAAAAEAAAGTLHLPQPGAAELLDVLGRDLLQAGEAGVAAIAAVHRPILGGVASARLLLVARRQGHGGYGKGRDSPNP